MLQVWFAEHPIHNYRDAARHARHDLFRRWWEGMLERGVLFHPGAFENLFVSFAHTEADIDQTLAAAKETARPSAPRRLSDHRARSAPVYPSAHD